jgi:hypothetical protein
MSKMDDPVGAAALLPDCYAGELAAMGRLLMVMSARVSRHALRTLELGAEARRVADELGDALKECRGPNDLLSDRVRELAERLRAASKFLEKEG